MGSGERWGVVVSGSGEWGFCIDMHVLLCCIVCAAGADTIFEFNLIHIT